MAGPGDATLVDRAAALFAAHADGDRAALDELVELVTPVLWQTVRAQGVEPAPAEDVVQTVWLRLLRSTGSIEDPQAVVAWLLTTARREAWRTARRERQEQQHRTALLPAGDDDPGGGAWDRLERSPAPASDQPEERVLTADRHRLLWSHVQQLTPRCQELVRVIAFADRPDYARLATSLGMPVGSIGPTRGRCLATLRKRLAIDPRFEGSES